MLEGAVYSALPNLPINQDGPLCTEAHSYTHADTQMHTNALKHSYIIHNMHINTPTHVNSQNTDRHVHTVCANIPKYCVGFFFYIEYTFLITQIAIFIYFLSIHKMYDTIHYSLNQSFLLVCPTYWSQI